MQVVSYAPQTLVVQQSPQPQPAFVDFVQAQTRQGIRGRALVTSIDRELPRFTVTTVHPHGGPPGQLKKQLGVQTGAEVVHGFKPGRQKVVVQREEHGHGHGRGHQREVRVVQPPMTSAAPPIVVQPAQPVFVPPGQAKKQGGGEQHGHGEGHDNGKGKGKGHGKD